jgi:urease accessory protein
MDRIHALQEIACVETLGWRARLALDFVRRGERTVLERRAHDGPLLVQKALYPEGESVCHSIIVHPPGGIAGGDRLELSTFVDRAAHSLLTTPGAAKWYRSSGPLATQQIKFDVAEDAALEWLPHETIVFDGALARQQTEIRLSAGARYIGWEVLCLGRSGAGERFTHGQWHARTFIERSGKALFLERAVLDGGNGADSSPVLLANHSVVGTLIAAAPQFSSELLALCRQAAPENGSAAVTLLPGIFVARYLGDSSEAAKRYFVALWRMLRPALLGKAAVEPRIWRT